jgi:uncharacterized protein YkwD
MALFTPLRARTPVTGRRRARTVASAAAVLCSLVAALVTAAPPAGATVPARNTAETKIGYDILRLMNSERAVYHLPALRMNSRLLYSARQHDVTMSRYNTMSHQCPGEAFFATRITRSGYHWSYAGENIGWNSVMSLQGVGALQRTMYNEKAPNNGHRLNILSSRYRDVGIDIYLDRAHHKVWMTQDFGRLA